MNACYCSTLELRAFYRSSDTRLNTMTSQMAFRSGPVQCRPGHLHAKSAVLGRPHFLQGTSALIAAAFIQHQPCCRLSRPVSAGKHARTVRHLTPVQACAVGAHKCQLICCAFLPSLYETCLPFCWLKLLGKLGFVQGDKDRSTTRRNLMQT